jgi:hypothetical protein
MNLQPGRKQEANWSCEYTVVTDSNCYYGWKLPPNGNGGYMCYQAWLSTLCNKYNEWIPEQSYWTGVAWVHLKFGEITVKDVPGYNPQQHDGLSGCVDVPTLAIQIFNYRTKQGKYAGT